MTCHVSLLPFGLRHRGGARAVGLVAATGGVVCHSRRSCRTSSTMRVTKWFVFAAVDTEPYVSMEWVLWQRSIRPVTTGDQCQLKSHRFQRRCLRCVFRQSMLPTGL